MRTVVVFGSGLVARPAIRVLLDTGHAVLVATNQPEVARAMLEDHPHGEVVEVDAAVTGDVRAAVSRADAAVSLLPVAYHVMVAEACVAAKRPFVTTSYVSEEMRALDPDARKAGVLLLNEIGADPGIDHMLTMRLLHRVEAEGGTVTGLYSVCGGIPAPEARDNPFGYKISWSPRGVVLAGRRPARYRRDGAIVHVGAFEIFGHPSPLVVDELGELEAYPNGDSIRFEDEYGLENPQTMFRGSLRWPGWCETWSALTRLGYVDDSPDAALPGATFGDETRRAAGAHEGESPRAAVARVLELSEDHTILERLEWLGLFSETPVPASARSRCDLLVDRMEEKMRYAPGERDLVVLYHEVEYRNERGESRSLRASLTEYGTPGGDSAMSRTVGLPAGIATRRIVDGSIREIGVQIPVLPSIYERLLKDLADAGMAEVTDREPTGS